MRVTSKEQKRLRDELVRLRQIVDAQLAMSRYAAQLALRWERRWEKLRQNLERWQAEDDAKLDFQATVSRVLEIMSLIENRLSIEESPPMNCDISRAELGYEGQHHCRTHGVWFRVSPGEEAQRCPVGRIEAELARWQGDRQ